MTGQNRKTRRFLTRLDISPVRDADKAFTRLTAVEDPMTAKPKTCVMNCAQRRRWQHGATRHEECRQA